MDDYLKELSDGWERRDVSSEEYVAALRSELRRSWDLYADIERLRYENAELKARLERVVFLLDHYAQGGGNLVLTDKLLDAAKGMK